MTSGRTLLFLAILIGTQASACKTDLFPTASINELKKIIRMEK